MNEEILLTQQKELQSEADDVLLHLNLLNKLRKLGTPYIVGSKALGLMTWRDIDITVDCETLSKKALHQIFQELMIQDEIREIKYINDTKHWNESDLYPDGLYLGFTYKYKGNNWSFDIWFVDDIKKQPDIKHVKYMPRKLTDEKIYTILKIKNHWCHKKEYGNSIKSFDIYKAVLEKDIQSLEAFNKNI